MVLPEVCVGVISSDDRKNLYSLVSPPFGLTTNPSSEFKGEKLSLDKVTNSLESLDILFPAPSTTLPHLHLQRTISVSPFHVPHIVLCLVRIGQPSCAGEFKNFLDPTHVQHHGRALTTLLAILWIMCGTVSFWSIHRQRTVAMFVFALRKSSDWGGNGKVVAGHSMWRHEAKNCLEETGKGEN